MMVMQILGLVSGHATAYDGQYLVEYDPGRDGADPDGRPMNCHLRTTPDPVEALRLPHGEMFELWRRVDPRQPIRPDGHPNRPLTAFTVEMTRAPELVRKGGDT